MSRQALTHSYITRGIKKMHPLLGPPSSREGDTKILFIYQINSSCHDQIYPSLYSSQAAINHVCALLHPPGVRERVWEHAHVWVWMINYEFIIEWLTCIGGSHWGHGPTQSTHPPSHGSPVCGGVDYILDLSFATSV